MLRAARRVERLELDLGVVEPGGAARGLGRMRSEVAAKPGPAEVDEEDRVLLAEPQQRLEQLDRRAVRPVQIVHHHDHRPRSAAARSSCVTLRWIQLLHRVAVESAPGARARASPSGSPRRSARSGQHVVDLVGQNAADRGVELGARLRLVVVVLDPDPGAQRSAIGWKERLRPVETERPSSHATPAPPGSPPARRAGATFRVPASATTRDRSPPRPVRSAASRAAQLAELASRPTSAEKTRRSAPIRAAVQPLLIRDELEGLDAADAVAPPRAARASDSSKTSRVARYISPPT